jgi:hypothetical protein
MAKGWYGITGAGLAFWLAACASTPVERVAPGVEASIALAPKGSTWEVRYALPRPATELRFERVDHQGMRALHWTPLDAAFEIVATPDGEVVRRIDGATFSHAGFAMPPRYVQLEKDYAPFSPFSDGGLLIHSGRFHACVERCEGGIALNWRLRIIPPAGAHAIVGGQVVAEADFIDTQPGTNVYVGKARPLDTPDVVAVVDPAMPAGVRDRLNTLLPRLMDLYGEELGRLPSRPMLFASRDERHPGGGYGYQGGTLPGQVFMHVYGRSDAFATQDFADRMDSFFAHEAAHMFQRYPSLAEQGDSWIHEGGAEAMALLALARLGEIGPELLQARVDGAVASCARGIGEAPLVPLPPSGRFELTYTCGLVVQMAVDAASRRGGGQACDLFCVWRDFQGRVDAGAPWTTETFVQVVADRIDGDTARFVREAVTTSPADPVAYLRAGLE